MLALLKEKKVTYISLIIGGFLTGWLVLLASSFYINDGAIKISELASKIEFLVHAITIGILINVYLTISNDGKKIIAWLLTLNCWLFIVDFCFYIAAYMNNSYLLKLSTLYFMLYFAPCIIYCGLMITFLLKMLLNNVLPMRSFLKIGAALIGSNIIIISLFLSSIHYAFTVISWQTISQILLLVSELVLFDFAILGLMFAQNKSMLFLLSGTIILVCGDFFLTYSYISQTVPLFSYGELLWLLGLIFIMFSALSIRYNLNDPVKYWFRKANTVKSKLAFWTFSVSTISFLIFFIFAYSFSIVNKAIFIGIPLFVMIYSTIVVFLSLIIGNAFEAPFKKISNNIETLLLCNENSKLDSDFSIEEFIFLQRFIIDTYNIKEEKERVKKEFSAIATQVAHDIRSPVSTILVLAKEFFTLPEEQRVSLREAANRIEDIANNLLDSSRSESLMNYKNKANVFLISTAILSVISEKKVQYKNTQINITHQFDQNTVFSCVKANLIEFKRVISNLLNNAIEAMNEVGNIQVKLAINDNSIQVDIIDQGKGMDGDTINKIFEGRVITSKAEGLGLGFNHARRFLSESNSKWKISSELLKGTTISLIFQQQPGMKWIIKEINLCADSKIIVLDDDTSIHVAWDSLLLPLLKDNPRLQVIHFEQAKECVEYIRSLDNPEKKNLIMLADYELINQNINGLDVIELTTPPQSILVTSHYENINILKRAALLNVKLVPKTLVSALEIHIKDKQEKEETTYPANIVVVEDNIEFADILKFLFKKRGSKIDVYHDPYSLFDNIASYEKNNTKFCIDLNLSFFIDGIDIARALYNMGFTQLYMASGQPIQETDVPSYIKILNNKIDVLNL